MAAKHQTPAILMGNEAIGRGLVEAGLHFMTAYPGTPSSEVLPSVVRFGAELERPPYCEWSVNEKVALETALSASYTGKRTACAMKQVGLNVALDPVMSSAYIGVVGGFIIVCADDPGPHSSQTEQDSRLLAHFAKLPVFDPDGPAMARDLCAQAFELSERFQTPVMLRPTLRVCHARQSLLLNEPQIIDRPADFGRDPFRWAAIPKMRLALHHKLNQRLKDIAQYLSDSDQFRIWHRPVSGKAPLGILASGVAAALARDVLGELGLEVADGPIPFLQLTVPYPLPQAPVAKLMESCERVLVLEETEPVIEMLCQRPDKTLGRHTGHVPSAGELTPDVLAQVLERVLGESGVQPPRKRPAPLAAPDEAPIRRPNLCPGCPHRAVFWALKSTFPGGVFPGDIGCYTLGLNQGAVDTCHNMGAGVSFGAAFSQVFAGDGHDIPVVSTIGDSTFYHSGTAPLINAVYNGQRFVLVVLDNETTGMTGMQPTPECGLTADGHPGRKVDLLKLIRGCGVEHLEEVDPYDLPALLKALRKARRFTQKPEGSVAVVVARHACVAHRPLEAVPTPMTVRSRGTAPAAPPAFRPDDNACADCGRCAAVCPVGAISRSGEAVMLVDEAKCTGCRLCASVCPTGTMVLEPAGACVGCGVCTSWFNCPALAKDAEGFVDVDQNWCIGCGLCVEVCAHDAFNGEVK